MVSVLGYEVQPHNVFKGSKSMLNSDKELQPRMITLSVKDTHDKFTVCL